jgi:hypothetical protein
MSIINEINFYILYKRERPCPAASHANRHALANRAGQALSADAWQLAWVGQKCRQNQLIMVRFLCHGESGSSMFCGCGVAIVWEGIHRRGDSG